MQKLLMLSWIAFCFSCNFIVASNLPTTDFIVTLKGDTVRGEILNIDQKSIFRDCTFKTNNQEQTHHPKDIVGFGNKDKYFTAQVVDTLFVESLVEGTISLYRYEEMFFVVKNDQVSVLSATEKKVATGNSSYIVENNKWRGILAFLINDCITNASSRVSHQSLNEKSLTKIILEYNKCSGGTSFEYKSDLPWSKLNIGLSGGYVVSNLLIHDPFNYYPYLPELGSTQAFIVGGILQLSFPRLSNRFSFKAEPSYLETNFEMVKKVGSQNYMVYESHVDLKTLSIPIGANYLIVTKPVHLFAEVGFTVDHHFETTNYYTDESVKYRLVKSYPQKDAFRINETQLGGWAGCGASKPVFNLETGLSFRFLYAYGLSSTNFLNVNIARFSINWFVIF